MTPAQPADIPEVEAFLDARLPRAMFPRANLAHYGLATGGPQMHRHAMRFWLRREDGTLTDVLGATREGFLLPACPTGPWEAAAEALRGEEVGALIGPEEEVRPLRKALGLQDVPGELDEVQPHFLLSLEDLQIPEGPGGIVPFAEGPEAVLVGWMRDYFAETLGTPLDLAAIEARRAVQAAAEAESHVVLMDGETPLAMAGLNARLPGIVQVGGVYTPPALRGRHHARRAVALHLAEAKGRGVREATLFAAGPPAIAAYKALGFRRIGRWTLCRFAAPQVIHG
ncbi:GNAT family N-acetyltransferase [Pseudoroseicyclus tamaricis]|uniref:GNAT family N-acetyltransferase n=1 Tax=Pseudoroseicyclus tamaricis TaxID=2705421 RepID=A0A6B2JKN9_9RHOB|nr:GNAT family N-acetyltransferase [Pseudoroseicyclus tamaricis]NDV02063.1 GNAT family N-acetyltransferase [Pseudoroseicyclus tamaricis]